MFQELQDKGDQQAMPDPEVHPVLREMQDQPDLLDFQDSVDQKEIRFAPCIHIYISYTYTNVQ